MHLDIARKVFCFDLQCRVDALGRCHSVFLGKRTGQHLRIDDDSRIGIVGIPGCILEPSDTS